MKKFSICLLIVFALLCGCQKYSVLNSTTSHRLSSSISSQETVESEDDNLMSTINSNSQNMKDASNYTDALDIRTAIDNKTPYSQKITHKYAEENILQELFGQYRTDQFASYRILWQHLLQKYKMECVRRTDTTLYCIFKTKENGLLYVFFNTEFKMQDPSNPSLRHVAYSKKRLKSKDFETIKTGSAVEDVQKIDPATEAAISHYGLERLPSTFHLLTDGVMYIEYQYDQNQKQALVTQKKHCKDSRVTNGTDVVLDYTILPQDYIH